MRVTPLQLLAVCTLSTACTISNDAYDDPDLDSGKSDSGSTPVAEGALAFGTTQPLTFGSPLVYLTFELSGPADIGLETARVDADLDTILYVYRPNGDLWGRYLAKNDDGGAQAVERYRRTSTPARIAC
jgi:hypothetical protein